MSTTTSLSLDRTSIGLNETVTLTATVTAASGTAGPVGSVTFNSIDTNNVKTTIGTAPLAASGVGVSTATLSISTFAAGSYQIAASYGGAFLSFGKSDSNAVQLSVAGAVLHNTSMTLSADQSTITAGNNPVTFTAHVFENDGGVIVPTGTVTFRANTVLLGQADLDANGNATATFSAWLAGTYTITAEYVGDRFNHGSSAQLTLTVNPGAVEAVDTVTTVTVDPAVVQAGATDVLITAHIAQTRTGAIPPSGDHVQFYSTKAGEYPEFIGDGDVTWTADGSAPATGVATLVHGGWPPGDYTITAGFIGDIYDHSSTGTAPLSVTAGSPTTLPYTGDTSGVVGSPANVQFQLLDGNANPVAAETVTITVNGQDYTVTTDAGGNAAVSVSLPAGSYPVTASFAGDDRFLASSGSGTLVITKLPTALAYTGDASVLAGSPATVAFQLTDQTTGDPLANEIVSVTIDGVTQSLTTDSNGNVSLVVTKPAGTYSISASFGGDDTYLASGGTGGLTVQKIPTTTTYTGDSTANAGQLATLSATLTDSNGNPLGGKQVTLSFGSSSCTVATNLNGVASCQVTVVDGPGSYPVTASFAGDATYLQSSGPGTMNVIGKGSTVIVDNVSGNFLLGSSLTLSGTLTANGQPLANKSVTLSFAGVSCTGTTDGSGVATCGITVPGPSGSTTTKASFAGDAAYKASSDTKPALVYDLAPGGGSFVVGDKTASGSVYFWGSQWWKQNALSKGDPQAGDPAAFKGFAANPSTPQCGVNWSTRPGNSTPPPKPPLPAYMAVIVTDHNYKNGPVIGGDTVSIVIVKTNAGYDNNPGHAGTGTVVATVCSGGSDDGSGNAGGSGNVGGGSTGGTIDCSAKKSNCESLLASPSVPAGSTVSAGTTLSILYSDDSAFKSATAVLGNGQSLAVTATPTSGKTPAYVDSNGGSKSTKYQSLLSFKVPSGLAAGSYSILVTAYDGDGDVDQWTWSIKVA